MSLVESYGPKTLGSKETLGGRAPHHAIVDFLLGINPLRVIAYLKLVLPQGHLTKYLS